MTTTFEQTINTQTLNLDATQLAAGKVSLCTLCTDIFIIVINMREQSELGTPATLRKLLKHYVDNFITNCQALHIDSTTTDAVAYALVAIIDETVLSVPGPCSQFWLSRPLQYEYYGSSLAGEKFYAELDNLLKEPETLYDALEVYFLCLTLGFEGKYLDKDEEREKIIYRCAKTLLQIKKNRKKPSPAPAPKSPPIVKRHAPVIPLWTLILIAVIIIISGWTSAVISVNSHLKKTVQAIITAFPK